MDAYDRVELPIVQAGMEFEEHYVWHLLGCQAQALKCRVGEVRNHGGDLEWFTKWWSMCYVSQLAF